MIISNQLHTCRLWVAKVHDFIKQLVDEDEIVANWLLLELLEVFAENGHQFMQEGKDEGGIGVGFGHREQDKIVVFDENERHLAVNWGKSNKKIEFMFSEFRKRKQARKKIIK